jgi:hypothetical protein
MFGLDLRLLGRGKIGLAAARLLHEVTRYGHAVNAYMETRPADAPNARQG